MNNNDLDLLLKGRTPLIVLETHDEKRALHCISELSGSSFSSAWVWTLTDGLSPLGFGLELKNPEQFCAAESALDYVKKQSEPELYVFCDLHFFLEEPKVIRLLKDIAYGSATGSDGRKKIILLSHQIKLPSDLLRLSVKASLSLPSEEEIWTIVREEARSWQQKNRGMRIKTDNESLSRLVNNLGGLTHSDVRRLAWGAIVDDGAITESDIPNISRAKFALMDLDSVLHFDYSTINVNDLAGFENLKKWLSARAPLMSNKSDVADEYSKDTPRGVLLFGVQGGGKSLASKAIAGAWGLPLLRMDMAALYNKFIGETEKNLREALALADLMSPCVLWIDEIEKGLAEDTENATSRRLLGTLLTWMSERQSRVFLVATSNDISTLPPELLRKGRFDEIFFVDLPDFESRQVIFAIHLRRRGLNIESFDSKYLATKSEGFTGAEIEQTIVSAIYAAANEAKTLDTDRIIDAINTTQPLSVLRAEDIASLRSWAQSRAVSV